MVGGNLWSPPVYQNLLQSGLRFDLDLTGKVNQTPYRVERPDKDGKPAQNSRNRNRQDEVEDRYLVFRPDKIEKRARHEDENHDGRDSADHEVHRGNRFHCLPFQVLEWKNLMKALTLSSRRGRIKVTKLHPD